MSVQNAITFPRWDYKPCVGAVSADVELGYQRAELEKFKVLIEECFQKIMNLPGADFHVKHDQYQKLKELRQRLREAKGCKTAYAQTRMYQWDRKICGVMEPLKLSFSTTSNIYKQTVHRTHFVEATLDIDSAHPPELALKLNIHKLEESLGNIKELKKSQEKLTALQMLIELIKKEIKKKESQEEVSLEEIEALQNKIKQVKKFGNALLTIDEKIMALKFIKMRDKNKDLDKELASHFDPMGADHAHYLLRNKNVEIAQKVNYLTQLLQSRFEANPTLSIVDYVLEWPKDVSVVNLKITKQELEQALKGLYQLQDLDKDKTEYRQKIYEYLLNAYDPTGEIRKKVIAEMKLNVASLCTRAAQMTQSIQTYQGKFPTKIFRLFKGANKAPKMPEKNKAADLLNKKMTDEQKKWLASLLKYHLVSQLAAQEWDSREDFRENVLKVNQKICEFGDKLQTYLKSKYGESVLGLGKELAAQGEYTFTLYIFGALDSSKELASKVPDLFNIKGNHANLNKFMAARADNGVLNAPFMGLVLKQIEGFQEGFKNCVAAIQENLESTCKKGKFEASLSALTINDYTQVLAFFDENYSGDLSKKEEVRNLLIVDIKDAVEQQQMLFDYYDKFVTQVRSLIIYYRDDSWSEMSEASDFIDVVNQQKLEQ